MTCPEIANFHREVIANEKGSYATLVVDATKEYKFRVEAKGYQPVEQMKKPLIGGQTLELNFTLQSIADLQAKEQQKALEEPGLKQLREGQELKDEGKIVEARAKFAEATRLKPDLYIAWLAMGDIDQRAGRNDDALTAAERCLGLKTDFPQCLALGMNAAQGKGDKAAYQKYAERYKIANPSDPMLFYNEAVAFLNKGDDAQAKPLSRRPSRPTPSTRTRCSSSGMVCFRTGDTAKAKELLQKFLDAAPENKEAPTAKEMLKYM